MGWGVLCLVIIALTLFYSRGEPKLNFPQEFLIVCSCINATCIFVLFLNFCCTFRRHNAELNAKKSLFSQIKRALMYIFGGCHLLHGFLYCFVYKDEIASLAMNITSMLYICVFTLFFYTFPDKDDASTFLDLISSMFISLANVVSLLVALLDSTYVKFYPESQSANTTTHKNDYLVEQAEPLLMPYMIGFLLLVLDFVFSETPGTQTINISFPEFKKQDLIKCICRHFFILVSFGLFCYVFTDYLAGRFQESEYEPFIIIQIVTKIFILLIFLYVFRKYCGKMGTITATVRASYLLNIWFILIAASFFGTLSYHITLSMIFKNQTLNLCNQLISIFVVAVPQAFLITITYMANKYNNSNDNSVNVPWDESTCFLFSIIGIINMGFWISDSINRDWLNVVMYSMTSEVTQISVVNFFLYLKISFHFISAFEFIKLSWERNAQ